MTDTADEHEVEELDELDGAEGERSAGPVRIVAAVVAMVLVGFIVLLATRDSEHGLSVDSPLVGELVPHIQGDTFAGTQFDIDEARGKWVVVNFFASWCVPCRREHPELIDLAARHVDDAVVVSIPFGDSEEDARQFFDELGGDWPV
ncbi:MAG: TlpA disulfide reductase family protein, partial [Actinomycetota bacterium]|nr:TlpA disulfide reductase family protein [Actinomycetota bacterium]